MQVNKATSPRHGLRLHGLHTSLQRQRARAWAATAQVHVESAPAVMDTARWSSSSRKMQLQQQRQWQQQQQQQLQEWRQPRTGAEAGCQDLWPQQSPQAAQSIAPATAPSNKGVATNAATRYRPGPPRQPQSLSYPEPKLLTSLITSCKSPAALHALILQYGSHFNYIHASSALVALAKMADTQLSGQGQGQGPGQGQDQGARLQQRQGELMHGIDGSKWHQWQGHRRQRSQLLEQQQQQREIMPSSVTPAAPTAAASERGGSWGLSELCACSQAVVGVLQRQLDDLQPRAVANSLWAAAKLAGLLHATAVEQGAQATVSKAKAAAAALQLPTRSSSAAAAGARGTRAISASREGTAVAAARTGNTDKGVTQSPGSTATAAAAASFHLSLQLLCKLPYAMRSYEAQHVSNTLYAMASLFTLATTPGGAAATLGTAGRPESVRGAVVFEPDVHVGSSQGEAGSGQGNVTAAGNQLSPVDFTSVLHECYESWGLAPVDCAALVRALQQHAVPTLLSSMTPQGLSNTLYALAVMGQQPDEDWLSDLLDAAQPRLSSFEPQHLSASLWALARMGFHPGDDWLDLALQAAVQQLPHCSPQALANMVWALAKLGYVAPTAESSAATAASHGSNMEHGTEGTAVDALVSELLKQSTRFGSQDCANSLWALAILHRLRGQQQPGTAVAGTQVPVPGGDQLSSAAVDVQDQEYGPAARAWVGPVVGLWERCSIALVCRAAECSAGASPQELCNTLWAASVLLPPLVQSSAAGLPHCKGAQQTQQAQRLQQMRQGNWTQAPQSGAQNNGETREAYVGGGSQTAAAARQKSAGDAGRALLQLLQCLQGHLHRCKPQELANAALACTRLSLTQAQPQPQAQTRGVQQGKRGQLVVRGTADNQGIRQGGQLSAMATTTQAASAGVRHRREPFGQAVQAPQQPGYILAGAEAWLGFGKGLVDGWWTGFWPASLQLLPGCAPQHLAAMLWAARGARRGQVPVHWVDAVLLRYASLASRCRADGHVTSSGGTAERAALDDSLDSKAVAKDMQHVSAMPDEKGAVATGESMVEGDLGALSAANLASVLCCLPPLGVRPSPRAVLPLLLLVEGAVAAGQLGSQGLAAVLWVYSWLARSDDDQQDAMARAAGSTGRLLFSPEQQAEQQPQGGPGSTARASSKTPAKGGMVGKATLGKKPAKQRLAPWERLGPVPNAKSSPKASLPQSAATNMPTADDTTAASDSGMVSNATPAAAGRLIPTTPTPAGVGWLSPAFVQVGRTLANTFLSASNLAVSTPRHLSTGALALALLGACPPPAIARRLSSALWRHVAALDARELAVLLLVVPRLGGGAPGPRLLAQARARAQQLLPERVRQSLAYESRQGAMQQGIRQDMQLGPAHAGSGSGDSVAATAGAEGSTAGVSARAMILALQQQQQQLQQQGRTKSANGIPDAAVVSPLLLSSRGSRVALQLLGMMEGWDEGNRIRFRKD